MTVTTGEVINKQPRRFRVSFTALPPQTLTARSSRGQWVLERAGGRQRRWLQAFYPHLSRIGFGGMSNSLRTFQPTAGSEYGSAFPAGRKRFQAHYRGPLKTISPTPLHNPFPPPLAPPFPSRPPWAVAAPRAQHSRPAAAASPSFAAGEDALPRSVRRSCGGGSKNRPNDDTGQ